MKKDLMNAMLTRKSVRNYLDKDIPEEKVKAIKNYLADEKNYFSPYGNNVRFELIEDGNVDTRKLVTNAPMFIVAIIENTKEALFDAGYVFENLVLFLESIGLNTCYLNSHFVRETVNLKQPLKENEIMILASPIGFEGGAKSFKAKGCDVFLKRHIRKSIDEMFFLDKDRNLIKDSEIREKLNYLVWAPSGLNRQPWRIVFDGDKANFYIDKKLAQKKRVGFSIHYLDIGIVSAHYVLAFDKNEFITEKNPPIYEDMEYVVSIK